MLGRYSNMRGLGINPGDIIGTTVATQRTIEEVLPTVRLIATDYERVSPVVNFVADYWYTVLAVILATSAFGAGLGAWFVLRKGK